MLWTETLGTLYKAPPPTEGSDGWITSATQIGKDGFGKNFNFLFFDPDRNLYAVDSEGLYVGYPPIDADDDWVGRAIKIGNSDFSSLHHLFFGPGRHLYAVTKRGSFYKGPRPTCPSEDWFSDHATLLSESGYEDFGFLFQGPNRK